MISRVEFDRIVSKHARVENVLGSDLLFSGRLALSSIRFVELIVELEEISGLEIDIDQLPPTVATADNLYVTLFGGGDTRAL